MGKNLDVLQRRFCEMTGFYGIKSIDAVHELWPQLTQNSKYNKVQVLLQNTKIRALQDEYSKQVFIQEPGRLLKKLIRQSETIIGDPKHKNYAAAKDTILTINKSFLERMGSSETNKIEIKFTIEERKEDPLDAQSKPKAQ